MIVFTSSFICKVKHEEYNLSCQTIKLSFTIHKIDVSIRKNTINNFPNLLLFSRFLAFGIWWAKYALSC